MLKQVVAICKLFAPLRRPSSQTTNNSKGLQMKTFVSMSFFLFSVLFYGCSASRVADSIQSLWDYPPQAKLRLMNVDSKEAQEHILPAEIKLQVSDWADYGKYYVEIATNDFKRVYGILEALAATKLTTLTTVKVEITPEILAKVMNNQVSQVTVSDPTEQKLIIRLTIGNRMPPEMQDAYHEKRVTPY